MKGINKRGKDLEVPCLTTLIFIAAAAATTDLAKSHYATKVSPMTIRKRGKIHYSFSEPNIMVSYGFSYQSRIVWLD